MFLWQWKTKLYHLSHFFRVKLSRKVAINRAAFNRMSLPAGIWLFKVNMETPEQFIKPCSFFSKLAAENTRTMWEIRSKLTIKAPERCLCRRVFIFIFQQILIPVLVFDASWVLTVNSIKIQNILYVHANSELLDFVPGKYFQWLNTWLNHWLLSSLTTLNVHLPIF